MDGFCDTCDALASHQDRARKLEILKDSRVGAFAVLGCVSYLLLQYALWCQPGWEKEDLWALALVPVLSRATSGYGALTQPGPGRTGLLAAFTEQEQGRGGSGFCCFCALCWRWPSGCWGWAAPLWPPPSSSISGISKWPVGSSAV